MPTCWRHPGLTGKEFSLLPKFASGAAMCRERATLMALIFSITGPMSAPSE